MYISNFRKTLFYFIQYIYSTEDGCISMSIEKTYAKFNNLDITLCF